jgi:hypothetical protein
MDEIWSAGMRPKYRQRRPPKDAPCVKTACIKFRQKIAGDEIRAGQAAGAVTFD